jgi:hypothetical protein
MQSCDYTCGTDVEVNLLLISPRRETYYLSRSKAEWDCCNDIFIVSREMADINWWNVNASINMNNLFFSNNFWTSDSRLPIGAKMFQINLSMTKRVVFDLWSMMSSNTEDQIVIVKVIIIFRKCV